MQMSSEPSTKIANERSFMSDSASSPSTSRTLTLRPSDLGGVCGRRKANTPKASEAPVAIRSGVAVGSSLSQPTIRPATIQPIVPKRRTAGNCFSGLAIWLNAIAFTSASVGL